MSVRLITASFTRAIERFAGDLCLHCLPLFQQVVAIRKTLPVNLSVMICSYAATCWGNHSCQVFAQ
jgi:hypothetical protein